MTELRVPVAPEHKLGAAAADIQEQRGPLGELWVCGHALKAQGRFLLARDDFDLQPGGLLDCRGEFVAVHGLAGGTGGDDADRGSLCFAGHGRETGYGPGGGADGLGLEAMSFVEAVPEPGLLALLAERLNLAAVHIRHQQLHGVGADIDDRAADGLHGQA